jgi:hypothetical protein
LGFTIHRDLGLRIAEGLRLSVDRILRLRMKRHLGIGIKYESMGPKAVNRVSRPRRLVCRSLGLRAFSKLAMAQSKKNLKSLLPTCIGNAHKAINDTVKFAQDFNLKD